MSGALTTEQRRRVRQGLIDTGFHRINATQDTGDGDYAETWRNGDNVVSVCWAPKVRYADGCRGEHTPRANPICAEHLRPAQPGPDAARAAGRRLGARIREHLDTRE